MKVTLKTLEGGIYDFELNENTTSVYDLWHLLKKEKGVVASKLLYAGNIICSVPDSEIVDDKYKSQTLASHDIKGTAVLIIMPMKKKTQVATSASASASSTTENNLGQQVPPQSFMFDPATLASDPASMIKQLSNAFAQSIGIDIPKIEKYLANPDDDELTDYVLTNEALKKHINDVFNNMPAFKRMKELNPDFYETLIKDKKFMKNYAPNILSSFVTSITMTINEQVSSMVGGNVIPSMGMMGNPSQMNITFTDEENGVIDELIEKYSVPDSEVTRLFFLMKKNKEKTDDCLDKATQLATITGGKIETCIDNLITCDLDMEKAASLLLEQ